MIIEIEKMVEDPAAQRAPTWRRRRGLVGFVLIAFGLAWGWEAVARLVLHWSLVNPLVQLPAAVAPAVAAVVVRRWVTREGFADSGLALRLRRGWPWYLVAWWGPLGIVAVTVAAAAASGRWHPTLGLLADAVPGVPGWAAPLLLTAVAPVAAVIYLGEEYGWTAWLWPRLLPDRPALSAILTGLISAVWHFPLAVLGYTSAGNLGVGLALWAGWLVAQEVIMSWLMLRTGSVWAPSLAHAGNNLVLVPLVAALVPGSGTLDDPSQVVTVLVLVAVALPLLRATRHRQLT